jgi:thiamine pyrophosphate-dependent acetolactate synthase large subunit-like protein
MIMTTSGPRSIDDGRMSVREALQVLAGARGSDDIVVTNQGASRVWPRIARHPLDFHYNPSTMGGAVPLALGIALACPERPVIVVSGDGALFMSLGSLVSVVAARAANLAVVVLENGVYEVTGGQQTPAARANLDYAAIARAAGFPTAREFHSASQWRAEAPGVLAATGPRFICLHVERALPGDLDTKPTPLYEQFEALRSRIVR